MNPDANPFITRLRLLTPLSEHSLGQLLAACGTIQTFPAHADVVRERAVVDAIHIVMEGWCCRYRILADGRRQFPAVLIPGDLCDLDGLSLRRIHFGVATLTPCRVARLPRDQVLALMESNRQIRDVFWWLLSVENAMAAEWTVCLGRRSTEERLAHFICELVIRLTTVQIARNKSFELPLTQMELGDTLGVSTVHINRTLQALRSRDILQQNGRILTVRNWDALRKIAGFNADFLNVGGPRLSEHVAAR